jgi:hypothetical protein
MPTEIKSHQLDNSGSNFERRFQEETQRIRTEKAAFLPVLDDIEEEPGVLDGIKRKWLGFGAVAAAAVGLTVIGIGHQTLGESIPNISQSTPGMLDRAKQNERANLEHAKKTGEPLISDQR